MFSRPATIICSARRPRRRDLAARVGLIEALATAHTARRNTLDVLKETTARADADPAKKAYARAALRAVTTTP